MNNICYHRCDILTYDVFDVVFTYVKNKYFNDKKDCLFAHGKEDIIKSKCRNI